MSKETAPSEKAKKDELKPHDELQASVRDQGKVFNDENQVPNEETGKAASEEDPEDLTVNEEKVESNDEAIIENSEETAAVEPPESQTDKVVQQEASPVDDTEKLAEKVMEEATGEIESSESGSLVEEEKDEDKLAGANIVTEGEISEPAKETDEKTENTRTALEEEPVGDQPSAEVRSETSDERTDQELIGEELNETVSDVTSTPNVTGSIDEVNAEKVLDSPEEADEKTQNAQPPPVEESEEDQTSTEIQSETPEEPPGKESISKETAETVSDMSANANEAESMEKENVEEVADSVEEADEKAQKTQSTPVVESAEERASTEIQSETPEEPQGKESISEGSAETVSDMSTGTNVAESIEKENVEEVTDSVEEADEKAQKTQSTPVVESAEDQASTEIQSETPEEPPEKESISEETAETVSDMSADANAAESIEKENVEEVVGSIEEADEKQADSSEKGEARKDETESTPQEIAQQEDIDDIHDDGDELVHADYSQYSKEELVATIKKLTKLDDFKKLDVVLNTIDPLFQKIKSEDRQRALERYIADGGSEEDFAYKNELDQKYDAYYKLIKERKHKFYGDLGRQKLENYEKASELLEKLRHLVDGEESTTSINAIKEIQEEWKSIGQVPPQHVRNLWASYNALMDRFYDNRSIYFELKELDRRKNLAAKQELCERAEKLEEVENLKDAIKELNELHNEYKHIGPVPKAEQEALWQRFKAASDKVYARRKTYYDDLKKDLEVNLEAKGKLRDEVQPFAEFDSDRIVEWNKKTQEILDIQKRWEAIGGLPRDRAHEVNKPFWSAFKRFFNNKNGFFKKLEGQREDNLKLKEELVAKANELKDSTDWNQTANELKKLQNDWRNIGPVPEKHRNEIYQRFKQACDFFFENRRNRFKEVEKEYEKNLKLKEDVCQRILKLAEEGAGDIGQLEALQEEWNNIGFVPKNAIRSSQEMFARAVDKFIASSSLDDDEKNKLKITTKLTSLKGTPNANRKLNKKEFTLRRQITNLENDISLWKNNLEFFANSKNADQVREEFDQKIENAKKQLKELKAQLKIIRDI